MTITRDPDYPPEAANLMAAFNRIADGHSLETVIEAAVNLAAAGINALADARRLGDADRETLIGGVQIALANSVRANVRRQPRSTDVIAGGRQ